MNVSVVGTGYVGLVTGVCLAEKGHKVFCVDIDQEKVDKINRGISPIHEQGLEELLKKNKHGNLQAEIDLCKSVLPFQTGASSRVTSLYTQCVHIYLPHFFV